jgi:diacylglycerol kinase (ATP)
MGKTGVTGIKRIINATGYSWKGICSAYKHEAAFRQELWLAAILVPAGIFLGATLLDKAMLVSSVLFVLVVELLNSAIESVVDRVGDEHHELAGRAKDMGSAAVLFALVITAIVWAAVLIEHPPAAL